MEKTYKKVGKRYVEIEPSRFGDIDFFEFSFLVESCYGRRPIARTMFFERVIDKYYYVLTQNERDNLYSWLNRNLGFQDELKNKEESCLLFNARFDKGNQYLISYFFDGENNKKETFFYDNEYRISKNTYIDKKYITQIGKLNG